MRRVLIVFIFPPPKDPESDPEEVLTEDELIRAWRVMQASQLGYEWCDAVEIADSRVDLHELSDLIDHGCKKTLAKRILI